MTDVVIKDEPAATEPPPHQDEFLDLDPVMRPVAQQYGREMFAFIMNTGMATQATRVLAAQAEKHHSKSAMHAITTLGNCFNQVANNLCQAKGWDEGMLAQCDRDIQLAFKHKIEVVPANSRIILNS